MVRFLEMFVLRIYIGYNEIVVFFILLIRSFWLVFIFIVIYIKFFCIFLSKY